jgi:hypothetical protein
MWMKEYDELPAFYCLNLSVSMSCDDFQIAMVGLLLKGVILDGNQMFW